MHFKQLFKRLDIYLIRKFLGSYVYSILLIMAIVVVFDFNEKLDKFVQNDAPWSAIVLDYYFNFIPYFGVKFSPLFIFISVIFFTSKLASDSEIIAILSSGVSFKRMMRPYMLSATLLAVMMFFMNSWWIPNANKKRLDFEDQYVKKVKTDYVRNVQMEIEPGVIFYMERYDSKTQNGHNFFLESYVDQKLVSKLTAKTVRLDTASHWVVNDYTLRTFDGLYESVELGTRMDTLIPVDPDEFFIVKGWSEQLTTPELKSYLERQQQRGVANIKEYTIEYHRRFSFPFSCFILTLIGVSLASRKVKGGMGLHLGVGLLISFTYILLDTISGSFATGGAMTPAVAVWLPNFLYLLIGLALYRNAPK